ncbi:MAG: hypothetical protein ACXW4P_26715 [Thermoanaerobaculia bacterium]
MRRFRAADRAVARDRAARRSNQRCRPCRLAAIPILAYDRVAAEWHAAERARLVGRGQTPSFADGQIAAIARVNELTLVTFNDADFRRFQGVRVVTWR